MMTIVSSRMNNKAPVSLVTTTATNESSPELPNSTPEPPPRRDRRIEIPPVPLPTSRSSHADRIASMATRLQAVVEELLDDSPIQRVALLHADVQELKSILEIGQAVCELLLGGPA